VFNYSVEVKESEATGSSIPPSPSTVDGKPPHKRILDEMLHCIDVAADFEVGLEAENAKSTLRGDNATSASVRRSVSGRRTWVALKMTALLPDPHALIAWSSHITASRKSIPSSFIEAAVPFPGMARIEDMDIILPSRSPPHPPNSYFSSSISHPSLTPTQIQHLRDLYGDLVRICTHAREKGIKVIVDAEYRCDDFSSNLLEYEYL
jgi:proline dehydrogenase